MNTQNTVQGSVLKLILAWGFVGIPLLWGLFQTLRNALALFD
jgi:hypothetical protein